MDYKTFLEKLSEIVTDYERGNSDETVDITLTIVGKERQAFCWNGEKFEVLPEEVRIK